MSISKYPNYTFIKKDGCYFIIICDKFCIKYDKELSQLIHDNINDLINCCKYIDFVNEKIRFIFPLFFIESDLCSYNFMDIDMNKFRITVSLSIFISNYCLYLDFAKVFNKKYPNYKLLMTKELDMVINFDTIYEYNIMILSSKIHDEIGYLKEFLDSNVKECKGNNSYIFGNYCIILSLHSYEIDLANDNIITSSAQEIIDYVKEHSPELFVNKLAELHM